MHILIYFRVEFNAVIEMVRDKPWFVVLLACLCTFFVSGVCFGWGSLVDAAVPGELVLPNALQEASVNIQSNAECRGMGSVSEFMV